MYKLSAAHSVNESQDVHSYNHMVCHYGELTLKGKNRSHFEDMLIRNLRSSFRGMGLGEVRKAQGRLMLEFVSLHPINLLRERASRVFGLANARPVWKISQSMDELQGLIPVALEGLPFRSFAVRCHRSEKRFPIRSQEICIKIGSQVVELTGAKVDLTNPELTIWIDVLSHHIVVGVQKIEGPHGLPTGVSGKVACLLSGGIDSPVASWRIMQRGCSVTALHFHSHPFTTAASQEKVVELARILAKWHGPFKLAMIPFGDIQQELIAKTPEPLRVILYRRFMMRIANQLAQQVGAKAIVTGDSLGQVASQTLSNMATVEAVSELPVLRPLVAMDKNEITALGRRIGTYETSIEPHQDCCTFLEPKKPATSSKPDQLEAVEALLDVGGLVEIGVMGAEWQVIE